MTNIKLISNAALGLGLVLLIAVNMLSENLLTNIQIDLTQHQLYTLTNGTLNILRRLEEPVTLRLYVSKKIATRLPIIGPYANRVEELLQEYARLANGKLRLEVINPEAFSEAEDRAVNDGLQGIPLADGETSFYFGLVASGPTDERTVIPFMSTEREAFLEYDVTKLIHQVAWPKKPIIGILDTLNLLPGAHDNPMLAMRQTTPIVLKQIQKAFDVRTIDKTVDRIPADISVLLLIQPLGLTEATYYAIDQFVLRGGRILVLVDPIPEDSSGRPAIVDNGFNKLLASWGLTMDLTKVVGDIQLARRVQYQREDRVSAAKYPAWIAVPQDLINNTDPITVDLGSLNLASTGTLEPKTDAKTKFIPLITSTKNAMLLNAGQLGLGADLHMLLQNFRPTGQTYTIAARITGPIKTAFTAGAPPKPVPTPTETDSSESDPPQPTTPLPAHISETGNANLLLIADTDLLQDRFWVQVQNMFGAHVATPSAANGSLLINALDNLSGDNDLISVRNRGQFSRPFTRISELRQAAELQYLAKEKELVARLKQTEQNLIALEQGKRHNNSNDGQRLVLDAAQQEELERFRQEKIRIRKELREVRHKLGKDIENLENVIKFFHLGFIPLLVAGIGVWLGMQRNRRRYSSQATTTNLNQQESMANA